LVRKSEEGFLRTKLIVLAKVNGEPSEKVAEIIYSVFRVAERRRPKLITMNR